MTPVAIGTAAAAAAARREHRIRLYLWNLAVLGTHEIDSAFWREWDLFRMPWLGIQGFLVFNLAVLAIALAGFRRVVEGAPGARGFVLFLAGAGIFAAVVHSAFILAGFQEFTLPTSLGLLAAGLVLSIGQLRLELGR